VQYFDSLVAPVAVAAGELEQLVCLRQDRTALARAGDADGPPTPELQQAFVAQQPQRAQRRVGVDAEHRRQIARWRESLTGPGLAVRDRPSDRRRRGPLRP